MLAGSTYLKWAKMLIENRKIEGRNPTKVRRMLRHDNSETLRALQFRDSRVTKDVNEEDKDLIK